MRAAPRSSSTPQPAGGPRQSTTRFARPSIPVALVAATLGLGSVLRLRLALVNAEANDPHLPVIRIIAFEHRFPVWGEAWVRTAATVSIVLLLLAHTVDIGLLVRDPGSRTQRPNDRNPRPIAAPQPPDAT